MIAPQSVIEVNAKMGRKTSQETREAVHKRIRTKISGSTQRPRLAVYRSVNHIYAQIIDDWKRVTLVAASTVEPAWRGRTGGNIAAAEEIGKLVAGWGIGKGSKNSRVDWGGGHVIAVRV